MPDSFLFEHLPPDTFDRPVSWSQNGTRIERMRWIIADFIRKNKLKIRVHPLNPRHPRSILLVSKKCPAAN